MLLNQIKYLFLIPQSFFELQLIQSAQAGSLRGKVTDEQLKVLLRQIAGQKREIKITRK